MTPAGSNRTTASGFTLLEVIVAMAIVGLGVVTLLEVFSTGLRLGSRSSARTEAVTLSRQVMDELLTRPELQDGQEEGSLRGAFAWRVEVARPREESGLFSGAGWELKEITLRVTYRDGAQDKEVEMKTLRLVRQARQ